MHGLYDRSELSNIVISLHMVQTLRETPVVHNFGGKEYYPLPLPY